MGFIIKKLYIKSEIELISPICISNGRNINTDIDVIRDYYGVPFIPGSSIAGAMRNYLKQKEELSNLLFGYSKREENGVTISKISNLIVHDGYFKDHVSFDTRDGVKLDQNKIVLEKNKYNWEIIPPGNVFELKLELNLSKGMENKEDELFHAIQSMFTGFNKGFIRLGFKKNRGFGKCIISSIHCKEYSRKEVIENQIDSEVMYQNSWMQFDWNDMGENIKEVWLKTEEMVSYYKTLCIPLKLKGGISIRRYASALDKPDFEHISNVSAGNRKENTPIIPGTSWAGAIRHRCSYLLKELEVEDTVIEEMLDCMFGFVGDKTAAASLITVDESNLITEHKPLLIRRTKIDSLTSSAFPKGLFDELCYFQGKTELILNIKNCQLKCPYETNCDKKWMIGLLILVKEEIENGYLPIGGQTAIGRGIFEKDEQNSIDQAEREDYLNALDTYINQKQEERGFCVNGNDK